ncbi:MAG: hypothetical protein IJ265_07765 [Oscillospiraceae bacterium]|nr:hypothetical protein [Oscillospiraceae bacterium]
MKRIYKFFAVVVALMICGIHIPTETCNALTPIEIAEIYHMINERIVAEKGVGIDVTVENGAVEEAWINRGVYWFVINHSDGLRNDINALNDRVSAIESGGVGSSADMSEIKESVNNTNTKLDEVQNAVNNIDVKAEMEAVGQQVVTADDGRVASDIFSITGTFVSICNTMWMLIGDTLKAFGAEKMETLFLDPKDYVSGEIYTAMVTLAYSIVLLFFAVQLVEATVKYEMLTLKSVILIVVRVAIAKLLIDNSGIICLKIMETVSEETSKILNITNSMLFNTNDMFGNFFYKSKVNFIGPLIDILFALVTLLLMVPLILVVVIIALCILVKLSLCTFELIALVVTSPVFIACWSSDVTKQYAHKFIVTFIQVSADVLYMTIIYSVGAHALSLTGASIDSFSDLGKWIESLFPQLLAFIAWGVMMIKPPKSLKNLIH